MPKAWKILPYFSDDIKLQLLHNRGFKTKKQIDNFLNPSLDLYKKDLEIPGTALAIKRIKKAIENQELIIVYGDYDVDGICASAIIYKALTSLGAKILPYIPHREKEGYGLSNQGLEFARDSGATVVITVDNGIVAINQAKFAKEIGIDLIITDHHLPLKELPDAFAIVHSIKMCGAGVAWCLMKEITSTSLSEELLQFVAIATIGDLIPLVDLGRAFVKEGIKILNKTKNIGLLALMNECDLVSGELTSYEIGHVLIPRLNAIGRLEHAIDALRLLCTKDALKARKLAKLLCETNLLRQNLTKDAVLEAQVFVSKDLTKKIHVLASKNWQPGIIGLIAGRIAEEHTKPVIALSIGDVQAKGSARSPNGVNIVELIRNCSDILIDVGGHAGAAGFTIATEKIDEFKKKLEDLMDEVIDNASVPVLEIDLEISSKRLSKSLIKELEEFEPFGFGNPKPILVSRVMRISDIRTLSEGKHLKFKADDIDAIAFGMGDKIKILENGSLVDLAYYLEINKFNGREILQLKIKDIQLN